MIIKPLEHLKKVDNLKMTHKGIVVFNNDPKKLGRVKCTIKGQFEESDDTKLPWVFPLNSYGLGGKSDSSLFSVPEVDSELAIVFPYDDIYMPMYIGYWQSTKTHQVRFDEDYPESYGGEDSTGTFWIVNKTKSFIEFEHTSGTKVRINNEGVMTLVIVKDKIEDIAENYSLTIGDNLTAAVGKNCNINIVGDANVTVEGNSKIITEGDSEINTDGDALIKALGNLLIEAPKTTLKAAQVFLGEETGSQWLVLVNKLIVFFNSHVHGGVLAGGANTGSPVTSMTESDVKSENSKSL